MFAEELESGDTPDDVVEIDDIEDEDEDEIEDEDLPVDEDDELFTDVGVAPVVPDGDGCPIRGVKERPPPPPRTKKEIRQARREARRQARKDRKRNRGRPSIRATAGVMVMGR